MGGNIIDKISCTEKIGNDKNEYLIDFWNAMQNGLDLKSIEMNKEIYAKDKSFVSGMDFSKWLNNEYLPNNPEYQWIKEVSSKSVKQSILNAERAFKNFFKGKSHFPNFKEKSQKSHWL